MSFSTVNTFMRLDFFSGSVQLLFGVAPPLVVIEGLAFLEALVANGALIWLNFLLSTKNFFYLCAN